MLETTTCNSRRAVKRANVMLFKALQKPPGCSALERTQSQTRYKNLSRWPRAPILNAIPIGIQVKAHCKIRGTGICWHASDVCTGWLRCLCADAQEKHGCSQQPHSCVARKVEIWTKWKKPKEKIKQMEEWASQGQGEREAETTDAQHTTNCRATAAN